ncbi:MAG: alkene reductase [Bdellovibrionales bacterium]|nr:alkene reductase [Bdellovibrionales bacterium]
MDSLFSPLKLGSLTLPNRIIMAPLTRSRAGNERLPNLLMSEYYSQRAAAGLILTEATSIHPMGVGYANTPGIWSLDQIMGWKKITQSVHENGGRIFLQLWHVGRISHSSFLKGQLPVAPSAIKPKGYVSLVRPRTEFETPRALSIKEIQTVIKDYKKAAENALEAEFDGVELHAANGYLIDQFLQDSSNQREDDYGGSIENRARFLLEATDEAIKVWGADRVGVHLAPRCDSHSMGDSNPLATFSHAVRELNRRKIAFIFTREHQGHDSLSPQLRKLFNGVFIGNEGFTKESATLALESGIVDAVAFGKAFIANPDLVQRFRINAPLNIPNPETFYTFTKEGYTDYPALT